jgi:hypothetical protein
VSEDLESSHGEQQGNLLSPTKEWTPEAIRAHRAKAKPMDFGRLSFESHLLSQLRHLEREVYVSLLIDRCRRLVAEIGPWMLAERKRRTSI